MTLALRLFFLLISAYIIEQLAGFLSLKPGMLPDLKLLIIVACCIRGVTPSILIASFAAGLFVDLGSGVLLGPHALGMTLVAHTCGLLAPLVVAASRTTFAVMAILAQVIVFVCVWFMHSQLINQEIGALAILDLRWSIMFSLVVSVIIGPWLTSHSWINSENLRG